MKPIHQWPLAILRRWLVLPAVGAACFLVGIAVGITQRDRLMFFLSLAVCAACFIKAAFFYRVAAQEKYVVLEGAAAQFAPKAAEKGIHLTLAPTDASAVFDSKWTSEALCNLLDNAVKYTPAGGTIVVDVISYQIFCCVNVRDSVPGIPETERAKVFQRFYRSPAAYETEGVGIGLYLARQITEGQGGYIRVSSQPDKGSCFSLYLPRS